MSRKALENTNEMCSCPLGILQYSLNRINSIYGRRIGKKVFFVRSRPATDRKSDSGNFKCAI